MTRSVHAIHTSTCAQLYINVFIPIALETVAFHDSGLTFGVSIHISMHINRSFFIVRSMKCLKFNSDNRFTL